MITMRYLPILLILLLASCSSYKSEEAATVSSTQPVPRPAPMAPPPPPKVGSAMPQESRVESSMGDITEQKASDKKVITKIAKASSDPIIAQLFKASMAFVVPDSTNITEDIKAQLLIDPSVDDVSKQLTVKGTVTKSKIQVSKIAIAKLTAPDFDVVNITPEEQALTTTEPTEWLWELQPKSAGKHDINLTITAVIRVDGDKSEHHLKTFEKTVTVEITTMQVIKAWLNKYWQWLVSTLLLPLAIYFYKEKFKKKD